jgi:hypothetical protein
MSKVKIQESNIDLTNDRKGKVAILIYRGEEDPVSKLDTAVHQYVGNESHHEFIDINMDNPWVRVILSGINEMEQVDFDPTIHKLKS